MRTRTIKNSLSLISPLLRSRAQALHTCKYQRSNEQVTSSNNSNPSSNSNSSNTSNTSNTSNNYNTARTASHTESAASTKGEPTERQYTITRIASKDPAQLRSEFDFLLNVQENPQILMEDEGALRKYKSLEEEIKELYAREEKEGDVERFIDSKTGHRVEKVRVPEYMHKYLGKSLDEKLDAAQDDLHEFFNNPRFTQTNPSKEQIEQWERDEYLVANAPNMEVDEEETRNSQTEIKKYEDEKLVEDFLREKSKDKAQEEFAVLKFDHLQEIFYDRVFVEETEGGEFVIRCGMNRLLASQYGNIVLLPSTEMAVAIAAEWEMQDVEIRGNLLPLTDLVTRAQDLHQEKEAKKGIKKKIHELFELDELIHREGVDPYLKSRMKAIWDPIIEWFNHRYNTKLIIYEDTFQMGNEDEVLRAVKEKDVLDNWTALELVTLMQLTSVTDSVTISLAIMHGALSFDHAFHASNLPRIEQSDTHGIVEGEIDVTFQDRKYKLAAYYYWCQILREWKQKRMEEATSNEGEGENFDVSL